jgi:hypothetical protein
MRRVSFPLLGLMLSTLVLAGCNSTANNAPPPDLSAGPVENPLPAPPSNTPSPAGAVGINGAAPALTPGAQTVAAPTVETPTVSTPVAPRTAIAARPSLVSDPGFELPAGTGCSGSVERFQSLIDNDLKTGHTTKEVRNEIASELTSLRSRCAAGEDTTDDVVLLRQRFGYPSS